MMHNQLDPTRPTQIAWANRLITDGPIHFLGQRLESRVKKLDWRDGSKKNASPGTSIAILQFRPVYLAPQFAMRIRMPKCKVQGLVQESAHHGCALVLHSFVENGLKSCFAMLVPGFCRPSNWRCSDNFSIIVQIRMLVAWMIVDDMATAKEEKMLYVTMTSAGYVALVFLNATCLFQASGVDLETIKAQTAQTCNITFLGLDLYRTAYTTLRSQQSLVAEFLKLAF